MSRVDNLSRCDVLALDDPPQENVETSEVKIKGYSDSEWTYVELEDGTRESQVPLLETV